MINNNLLTKYTLATSQSKMITSANKLMCVGGSEHFKNKLAFIISLLLLLVFMCSFLLKCVHK